MIGFLRLLGLAPRVHIENNGFGVLVGRSGAVAVHGVGSAETGARPGETQLSGEVPDVEAAAEWLRGRGIDTVVWDESYGRVAGIRDGRGGGVWLNQEQDDLYGYRLGAGDPGPIDLVAVYFTDDFAGSREFLSALDFRPIEPESSGWQRLSGASGHGLIGLHAGDPSDGVAHRPSAPDDPVGPPALVKLSFETAEPLDTLTARLHEAGYADAHVVAEPGVSKIMVTDPDGCELEIHRAH
jgi:hypothetical protein